MGGDRSGRMVCHGVIKNMALLRILLSVIAMVALAGCEGYSGGGFYGEGPDYGVEQPDVVVTGGYGGDGYNHHHYYGHPDGGQYHQAYIHGGNQTHAQMHGNVQQGGHAGHGSHGASHK